MPAIGFDGLTRHGGVLAVGAIAVAAYAALISWFASTDVYAAHFFDHGALIVLYNLLRIIFAGALAWLIYAPGAGLLVLAAGADQFGSLTPGERYALGFFTGAGLWHLVLFGIGFAGGYTRPVAVALTVTVLALSTPHLTVCLCQIRRRLPAIWGRADRPFLVGFAIVAALFVAIKILYPSGSNDYYSHYFYYYIDVIKNKSLMPNEAWYHFYYSKGWGLYYLAILLTDPLAPQLVTATFVFTAALTIALILKRVAGGTKLPWIGATLFLGLLIYTPSPPDLVGAAGWAELAKGHELCAPLFLGLFWMMTRLIEDTTEPRPWVVSALATILALVLAVTEMAVIAGAFLVALGIWGAVTRRWRIAGVALACASLAGTLLIAVFAINYALTGIPSDQLLLYFWPIVDLKKVARWGVLSEVLWQHYGLTGYVREKLPVGWGAVRQLYRYLRLDLLWPFAAFGGVGAVFAVAAGDWRSRLSASPRRALIVGALAFAASFAPIAAVLGAGPSQVPSVYRFSAFAFAPTLCAVLLLCAAFPCPTRKIALAAAAIIFAIVLTGEAGKHGREMHTGMPMLAGAAFSFATGRVSIEQAYRDPGWPGRYRWGGIYPAMEETWEIVGRGTPIYSFNLQSYCMLPDCRVLSWDNTRTVPDFDAVLFGTPDEAVAAIKRAGINYFFYSTELGDLPNGIATPIVLSPIFAPDAIAQYFGIKWTDGTSYLLTWRPQSERPVDESFLAAYRRQVREAPIAVSFPLAEWRAVFEHFRTFGLHPYRLPWCVVCPGVAMD